MCHGSLSGNNDNLLFQLQSQVTTKVSRQHIINNHLSQLFPIKHFIPRSLIATVLAYNISEPTIFTLLGMERHLWISNFKSLFATKERQTHQYVEGCDRSTWRSYLFQNRAGSLVGKTDWKYNKQLFYKELCVRVP